MTVVRPLRKARPDGTPYFRRASVEAEIKELLILSDSELLQRATLWPRTLPGFISTEALVYFVRNLLDGAYREKLIEVLLLRVTQRVRFVADAGGETVSLTRMNIREDVRDHFIDLLLSDKSHYDDRLDYYEVSFNSAIAADRRDANARHWKHENRSVEFEADEGEVMAKVESALGDYNPFDADEIDKKDYRLLLDEAIDGLPDFQQRIVIMWRQEIPIESSDSSVESMCKVLGKSEKTIRTHRDRAFASLKLRLERKGKM